MRLADGEPEAADDVAELRWFAPDELPGPDELAFTTVVDALEAWRDTAADMPPGAWLKPGTELGRAPAGAGLARGEEGMES